ncbi:unnamed protein product [Sphenostylis stenocarpa]|uniref:Uncharacterized protein n=1 Tax=Sphenostylis stenocarpa TaxID=92480 RepID=A0AA86TBS5_9FABA|nr:unnamed protein product [Sphenostylis stenocarpa]
MLGCCLLSLFGFVAFSAALRYGYYGDSHILLGPASSRLIRTSSVFVKQLQVSSKDKNQVFLHAFNEKPELSSYTNWNVSDFFLVEAYKSKGSTIRIRWKAHTTSSLDQLHGMVAKGDMKFELLQTQKTSFLNAISLQEIVTGKEAEYLVEEDDRYHIGVLNMNARNIILTMEVNISAKVYDTTKAKKMCSTAKGSFLGVYEGEEQHNHVIVDVTYRTSNVVATQTETEPLMGVEDNQISYGTNAKDEEEDSGAFTIRETIVLVKCGKWFDKRVLHEDSTVCGFKWYACQFFTPLLLSPSKDSNMILSGGQIGEDFMNLEVNKSKWNIRESEKGAGESCGNNSAHDKKKNDAGINNLTATVADDAKFLLNDENNPGFLTCRYAVRLNRAIASSSGVESN